MKKVGPLVFLAIILAFAGISGGWYLKDWHDRPVTVSVWPEIISTDVSNGYVLLMNKIGDFKNYARCQITNPSFYWVETEALLYRFYDSGYEGILISTYAAQGLRNLIKEGKGGLAYKIAQEAFEKLQRDCWGKTEYKKLIYPLRFAE